MNKAQGSIEYLLIIAAAILVIALVIIAVTGVLDIGQQNTLNSQDTVNDVFDNAFGQTDSYFLAVTLTTDTTPNALITNATSSTVLKIENESAIPPAELYTEYSQAIGNWNSTILAGNYNMLIESKTSPTINISLAEVTSEEIITPDKTGPTITTEATCFVKEVNGKYDYIVGYAIIVSDETRVSDCEISTNSLSETNLTLAEQSFAIPIEYDWREEITIKDEPALFDEIVLKISCNDTHNNSTIETVGIECTLI